MSDLEHFKIVEEDGQRRAEYWPEGEVTLQQGVAIVKSAILLARVNNMHKILVVTNALIGFPPPKLHERYVFVTDWCQAAGTELAIAMVARPEMIDPHKFGVKVAENAGVTCDVFESVSEALEWLRKLK